MNRSDSGEMGFKRSMFPYNFRDHELHLLHNDASETVDGRLQLHLTLHCPKCDSEQVVRGRLPKEVRDYNYRAALAKFITLGYFAKHCDQKYRNSYHGY